jgi:hypothetical protein
VVVAVLPELCAVIRTHGDGRRSHDMRDLPADLRAEATPKTEFDGREKKRLSGSRSNQRDRSDVQLPGFGASRALRAAFGQLGIPTRDRPVPNQGP